MTQLFMDGPLIGIRRAHGEAAKTKLQDEPRFRLTDKPSFPGAFSRMWRSFALSALVLCSIVQPAVAGPELGDDIAACRDRQGEAQARLDACERVIVGGKAAPKDLAIALGVRGNALLNKRDYDKAIAAYTDALKSDPDNVGIIDARGIAYERKGQDDLAMADYNLALQKRPTFAAPYNNRGTVFLRRGALQSALDDFSASIKYAPNWYLPRINRARLLTYNGDFDGALADLADAQRIDPNSPATAAQRCRVYTGMGKLDDAI